MRLQTGDKIAYSLNFLCNIGMQDSPMVHARGTILGIAESGKIHIQWHKTVWHDAEWDGWTDDIKGALVLMKRAA